MNSDQSKISKFNELSQWCSHLSLKKVYNVLNVSVIKRLSLYVFVLWGQDLVSVVRIREGPYYRGAFKENM